jgi:FKBP-type peptidyl-prolyl cis-trans isomerase 2
MASAGPYKKMQKENVAEQAGTGDTVKVFFTSKLEDGTVLDTSAGKDPLQFTIGKGQVIEGLEKAVTGMTPGESKTVIIPPEEAFGRYLQEKAQTVPRDHFPENIQPAVGMKFEIRQEDGKTNTIRVTGVTDTEVTLDSNHPLAGKELLFDIELIEVAKGAKKMAREYYMRGIGAQDEGRLDEAISYYQKALELDLDMTEAYYNMGVAHHKKGDFDKAAQFYLTAIGQNPNFPEAHHNLGMVFKEKGMPDDAIACFKKAIEIRPDYAEAHYNLGNAFVMKGQFYEALQSYGKTLEIRPEYAEAHWNISLLDLLLGRFEAGWKGYEWRWELKDVAVKRGFVQPEWDGSDISGRTILLYSEQGFGDAIQFIRYVPLVAENGARVVVECPKELASLLKGVKGVHEIISDPERTPDFDLHCPIMSLPLRFNTSLENIPAKVPYIDVDPVLVRLWSDKVRPDSPKLKVGLAWAGDPKYKTDYDRSCRLDMLSPLAEFDNIIFYSLQKGVAANQALNPPKDFMLFDYTADISDFSDTAALIQNLDLVISVDTAVAHLAGALGKPVWTLLPFVPDWRWMLKREDSPWYPTMRLFRQPARWDWASVVGKIKEALGAYLKTLSVPE